MHQWLHVLVYLSFGFPVFSTEIVREEPIEQILQDDEDTPEDLVAEGKHREREQPPNLFEMNQERFREEKKKQAQYEFYYYNDSYNR